MNKSSFFSGQPVFSQLIKLIPASLIRSLITKHNSDYYYKSFKTKDHLVTMLYACFHNCTSLREVITGLHAHYNKLDHIHLKNIPRRSTLSDANSNRDATFFEDLYHQLYKVYYGSLPDSLSKKDKKDRLFIMDSTTISLFTDILKGAGSYGNDGRKKGGVKAHVLLKANNDLPELIRLTAAADNDRKFMEHIKLPRGSILVFDKGYHKFSQWYNWHRQGINWVTRLTETEVYKILKQRKLSVSEGSAKVIKDEMILLGRGSNAATKRIQVRLITYHDAEKKQVFKFLTNNPRFSANTIAAFYKDRWQIENYFKKFKQTSQVKYFLGDSENAIKIQIWIAFIKNLLTKIIKDRINRKWSFANLAGMLRHHLMNYINLAKFLNEGEKAFIKHIKQQQNLQPQLFP